MSIEEAYSKIIGKGERFPHQNEMLGHTLSGGVHVSPNCEHCNDIRDAMLAVLEMGEFDCCFERREFGKCRCAFSNDVARARIAALGQQEEGA